MSVIRLGSNIVRKATILPTVTVTVGSSTQRRKSDNVVTLTFGGGDIITDQGSKTIVYTTKRKRSRNAANFCYHLQTRTKYGADPTVFNRVDQLGAGLYYYLLKTQHTASAASHTTARDLFLVNTGAVMNQGYLNNYAQGLINLGLSELKPDLTAWSAPNFIYELEQVKGLFKFWQKNLSLRSNLAGAHLNYKFGWKPTASDLKDMVKGALSLQERLNSFISQLNTLSHRSKVMYEKTFNQSGSFLAGDPNYQCEWSGTFKAQATAHIVYAALPLYPTAIAGMNTLLSSVDDNGFELNPRIIWDAIPLSFVVDYFIGIGRWLNTFRYDALELPIQLIDSYCQYKQTFTVTSLWNEGKNVIPTQGPISYSGGWWTEEKFFRRLPIKPDQYTLNALQWKAPSLNQATLLVSLAEVLFKV